MAEGGLVEGVVGDEPEGSEPEADLGKIDPLVAAIAVGDAKADPDVAQGVLKYLDDLRELIRLQIKHFDEERRLAIHAAKRKRFADRIRYGALLGAALLGLGAVAVGGVMVWEAVHANGVVVEAFSVPPDLAARGFTGQVLATELQDQLNAMQEDTVSGVEQRRAEHDGASNIKVELPETGISLGELNQSLRQWLGSETQVSGEVYRTGDPSGSGGVALTVRVGDAAGQRWTGTEAGIDTLLQAAAEKVYGSVAPFRFTDWLSQKGRDADAMAMLTKLASQGSAAQMSEADVNLAGLGIGMRLPIAERLGYAQRAVSLDPQSADARFYLGSFEGLLGHAMASLTDLIEARRLRMDSNRSAAGRDVRSNQIQFGIDVRLANYQQARQTADSDEARAQDDPDNWSRLHAIASTDIHLHDLAASRAFLRNDYTPDSNISATANARREASYRSVAETFDEETGDWAGALANTLKAEGVGKPDPQYDLTQYAPTKALALAKLGRQSEAEALIGTTPADCYECLWMRGRIAAETKDWPTADHWFAEAVRQAPMVPFAYYYWGLAREARGDLAGAITEFRMANQTGPHWADPLKALGDVLAKQGQWRAALAQYDAARKYAPAWVDLRQARDAAAGRS